MAKHILKSDPDKFQELWDEQRTIEVRIDDRNFEELDDVIFAETRYSARDMRAGKPLEYTGRAIKTEISTILRNLTGLHKDYCILGIVPDDFSEVFDINTPLIFLPVPF